jgi:hypothetical protein
MQYMTDYIQFQIDSREPLDFIKTSEGHDLLKMNVCAQKLIQSKIDTTIEISSSLKIMTDKTQLEETQDNSMPEQVE